MRHCAASREEFGALLSVMVCVCTPETFLSIFKFIEALKELLFCSFQKIPDPF